MFLETQGVVDLDGADHWEFRIFHLDGAITLFYEPITSQRSARQILADARAERDEESGV